MVGMGHASAQVLRVANVAPPQPPFASLRIVQGFGAEAQQNRLDDRGVIEECLGYRARFHPRRHDHRWYPHPVPAERLGVVVHGFGRHDVVEEASVFVVGDDQQRTLPLRAGRKRIVDSENEVLAILDIGGRVVVIRWEAERVEAGESRVDPGDGRQRAGGGVFEKACCLRVDPDLESGFPAQAGPAEIGELVMVSEGVVRVG